MNKEAAVSASSIVARSQEMIHGVVDGGMVMINPENGTCYGLNRAGSRIWVLIEEPRRVDDVCAALVAEFDVDQATCNSQVLELLHELRAEGMVELRDELAISAP